MTAPIRAVVSLGRSLTDQAVDAVRGVTVLTRRGLFDPLHPREAVHAVRCAERWGPIAGVVRHRAETTPDDVAIVDDVGALTFRELDGVAEVVAQALAGHGVGGDDAVAVLGRDGRGVVAAKMAGTALGARIVLLNTGFAGPQLAGVLARERVSVVLHDAEFTEALAETTIPSMVLEEVVDTTRTDPTGPRRPAPDRPGGIVLLSSGTTGTPKGAPRERVSILQSAAFLDRVPLPAGRPIVVATPLFHGTGLSQFILGLALGSPVILHRRFDAEATLESVARHRAGAVVLVPTMLQRIVDLGPEVHARHDTSSLRVILSAGSPLPPDLARRTAAAFGPVLHNLYGSTEVAVALVATPRDLARAPGTVGRPPVGCRVSIHDDDGAPITEPGTVGRIFARSSLSFSGYSDGRGKEIIDGKLSTGDVGHVDADGLFFVDGRDDDMIVSGGENVYPLEVEDVLTAHPDVVEAAVTGVDDPEYGTRLCAHVVVRPGGSLDADGVRDHVRSNLARFKVPRDVVFLDRLPRNATGKVVRRALTDVDDGPSR